MSEPLQVDVDALRGLAKSLRDISADIGEISVPATTEMPGFRIEAVARDAQAAVLDAYHGLGESIHSMAEAADVDATGYEAAEHAFREQLTRYEAGR
ncbi:hypothetical protein AB4Z09_18565 [Rhodococcus sp. TAF43]|uniref:hypothetical protein n=1 Tax=Rhodococcus sp. TAF43 TaxID=3237483 RepID=UPI003F968BE3